MFQESRTQRYTVLHGIEPYESLLEIKRSEFIGHVKRVYTTDEARAYIDSLRKSYHDARHVCSAFVLGADREIQRSSDDGEPAGTAGIPMLQALLARQTRIDEGGTDLSDLVAVVVRYFGGIKLGVSGLIEAYRTATADALAHCEMVWREVMVRMRMEFGYEDTHNVYATLKRYEGEVLSEHWNERCQMEACFKKAYGAQAIAELSALPQFEVLGEY